MTFLLSENVSKTKTIWSLISLYGAIGILTPFFSVWLAYKGFSENIIAILLFLSLISRSVGTLIIGSFITHICGVGKAIVFSTIVAMLLFNTACFMPLSLSFIAAIFCIIGTGFIYGIMPLIEQLTVRVASASNSSYSSMRAYGSLAFLLSNVCIGSLLYIEDFPVLIPLCIGLAISLMIFTIPINYNASFQSVDINQSFIKVLLLLTVPLLLQASHAYYYAFGILRWIENGISISYTGLLFGMGVCFEVIAFRIYSRCWSHLKSNAILSICSLVTALRWFILSLNPPLLIIVIAQIGHGFSFAFAYATTMLIIRERLTKQKQHTAQITFAFGSSCLALGGATALLPLLNQYNIDPYIIMAFIAIIALVICIFSLIFTRFNIILIK